MVLPKLHVVYSPVYDMVVQEWRSGITRYNAAKFQRIGKRIFGRENLRRKREYALKLDKDFGRISGRVFHTLERVSGLRWKERSIICYVIESDQSLDDPMTLQISNDLETDRKTMIHELGHRLISQNFNRLDWDGFVKTFKGESQTTISHILLHAVLKLTYQGLFGAKVTKRYIESYHGFSDYMRAWRIVEEYGAERLIDDFIKTKQE